MSTPRSPRALMGFLAAMALVACRPPQAREPARNALDPDVEIVLSGAHWKYDEVVGTHRVVVRTSGFEHPISEITIEWLSEPGDRRPARVVRSAVVSTGRGRWRVRDPILRPTPAGATLEWTGVDTHESPVREYQCSAVLSPRGTYEMVGECRRKKVP
jgi:hypothetical protein